MHTRALILVALSLLPLPVAAQPAPSPLTPPGAPAPAPDQTQAPANPPGNPPVNPSANMPIGASVVLPSIAITGQRDIESLPTDSASERRISGETLNTRPIERPGEMLEAAPGLIVTQHSGEGKANQYFLRGFNLDHGTDLAIWLDGMPVNMRTHGHGQGYADVNFLIPELVSSMLVRKGPYWAQEGDFASAGTLRLDYAHRLDRNILSATGGSYGYWRGLAAGSTPLADGTLTGAGEIVRYDGPWVVPDSTRKYNGVLRYTEGSVQNGFSLTAMAYTNSWHSTDQIPQRAWLDGSLDGSLGRFGAVDQTDGGDAQRYSLSARWARTTEASAQTVEGYFIYQTLNLYNNFTYFLDNPTNGDQFLQSDKRKVFGVNLGHTQKTPFLGFDSATTLGAQFRYDDIAVGLFNTTLRTPTNTIRNDQVSETSLGLYGENKTNWTPRLRTILGVRGDMYWASVASDTPANSGPMNAFLASPKAGVVLGPFAESELFLNAGLGFHSNDARGTVITVDPSDRTASQQPVPLLVRTRGAEIGARTQAVKGLDAAVAFFVLEMNSEILFVGDAGTTVASRPSRRTGIEWTSHYQPLSWLRFDFDFAYSDARFTDYSPAGDRIPGAPGTIAQAGIVLGGETGWFGALRWRYFGARPLTQDGSVSSTPTALFNARVGYVFDNGVKLQLDGFNIFNAQAQQVAYFYRSQLRGEAAAVNDVHFHPVEPFSLRFTITKAF